MLYMKMRPVPSFFSLFFFVFKVNMTERRNLQYNDNWLKSVLYVILLLSSKTKLTQP